MMHTNVCVSDLLLQLMLFIIVYLKKKQCGWDANIGLLLQSQAFKMRRRFINKTLSAYYTIIVCVTISSKKKTSINYHSIVYNLHNRTVSEYYCSEPHTAAGLNLPYLLIAPHLTTCSFIYHDQT